jgi:hypothetical protein
MNRRRSVLRIIGAGAAIFLCVGPSNLISCAAEDTKKEIDVKKLVDSLDAAQRQAIVEAANKASHEHMMNRGEGPRDDEIAEKSWGEAIAKLKPLRVRFDRVNVAIVLWEDPKTEEGLYVSVPISSYAPRETDFLLWKKLTQPDEKTFGQLYWYRQRR